MINAVTRFLVVGAGYPCPGEVPHSKSTTLVLPKASHHNTATRVLSVVGITAKPRDRLMLTFELHLLLIEDGDGDLPLGLL